MTARSPSVLPLAPGEPSEQSGGVTVSSRREFVRTRLVAASRDADRIEAEIAELLTEVQDRRYWRDWEDSSSEAYSSFEAYVAEECAFSARKAQVLTRNFRRLRALGVAAERIRDAKWSKVELIVRVADESNLDELLDDLGRLSYRELADKVCSLRSHAILDQPSGGARSGSEVAITGASPPSSPRPGAGGWRLPLPPADRFHVSDEIWEQLGIGVAQGRNILLVGPSGCGKSELVELIAETTGRPFVPFNFGAMSEPRGALIGNTHLDRRRGTRFQESRFVAAVRRPGTVILLDEINRCGRDASNILLTLLDRQGYLALDESEDGSLVHRAPGVSFFATANLGAEYTNAEPLDKALADRFWSVIELDFLPRDKEMAVLMHRCPGLGEKDAERLVELAARQRDMAREGEFVGSLSTRSLLAAGEQVAAGVPLANALKFTVLSRFSAEGGDASERATLLQIFQKTND